MQLVPQDGEVRMTARTPTAKKTAKTNRKAATTAATKKTQPTTTAPPAARKAATTVPNRRPASATATLQRTAVSKRLVHAAATTQRPILRRAASVPPVFAQPESDNVMRGTDTVSLIARLPWWRNDRMQAIRYGSEEAESKVLAAADAWLTSNSGESGADDAAGETFALAAADETAAVLVAESGEPNDIDLAATSVPAPSTPTFLQSLIALLGGAMAAAASARFLFV